MALDVDAVSRRHTTRPLAQLTDNELDVLCALEQHLAALLAPRFNDLSVLAELALRERDARDIGGDLE